ncbi:MAG TPA: adenylate/guanylate cyclase domain-containing protein, partial [Caldilineaceae bacterium]|nr:adenylate/guanylate cyclase domain-containing protein [Caldilineaceae bacterium]
IRVDESGWPNDELQLAPRVALALENHTQQEQLLALERMAYNDDAATAADVFALQVFRDLFAEEALRPGDPISVGSMVVVFTDLRQSTQLYRTVGDAVAFGLVMEHFDLLRAAVDAEGGAIVKLLGDSVMAVFRRPIAAVRAMRRAQQELAALTGRPLPLRLRAGIHYGPCIAVTMNDRLDYFGSTINAAARLTDFSSGDDLILSGPVRWDPEVVAWLDEQAGSLERSPLTATLKGFEAERFELWRVSPIPPSAIAMR